MHLITATKKGFSSSEMQRQIGHKRYEPIWAMMHKIRSVMGKRDEKYQLEGLVEDDEAFFEIAFPEGEKTSPNSDLITDQADAYNYAFMDYKSHQVVEGTPKEKTAQLPWVHISISNAKRKLLDIHHCISDRYLQRYLDEFCYKQNRRNMQSDSLFGLLKHAVNYKSTKLVRACG